MKKFRFTMAVLTGLAAFAFTAGAQAKIKLAVSHPPMGLHLLPVLVAEDRGFFAAEGLEIKHSFMAGGSAAAAAMIGVLSVALGLTASFHFDTPSGPSIVTAAVFLFMLGQIPLAVRS